MLENPPEPQLPERRPVGRPRKTEDIEELHRRYEFKQLQIATRIQEFLEERLDALKNGIKAGALTKMDFESFKVAVSANVESQKSVAKAKAERPPEQPKDDFNIDAFLKGQE